MSVVQFAPAVSTIGDDTVATFGASISNGNGVLLAFMLADYLVSDPAGDGSGLGGASGSPPNTLFDDKGNAYTLLRIWAPLGVTNNPAAGIYFYGRANITNAPSVITLKDSNFRMTCVGGVELAGRGSSFVVDSGVDNRASYAASTSPSASFTPTEADVDVLQVTCWDGTGTDQSYTAGSGWSKLGPSAAATWAMAVRNCPTVTSYTADGAYALSQAGDVAYIGIKAAAAPSGSRAALRLLGMF